MPELSVVIPTRNRWPLLSGTALPSALAQGDVDLEVVVVDDGSTDDTIARLAEVTDQRVRIVRRDRSGGMAAARNAGIAAARGEWVAFLDDDDLWAPRKLRTQIDAALRADADFVYAGVVAVDRASGVVGSLYLPPADELAAKLLHACVIPAGCSNVVVRGDALREVGGFDEGFRHLADWDLWLRLSDRRAAMCDEVLVAYVLHPGNMHAVDDSTDELDDLACKHASASPPRQVAPDRVGYARWVAGQRSRAGLNRSAASMYLRSALRYRTPGDVARAVDALLRKRVSATARRMRGSRLATDVLPETPDWLRHDVP
jgi:glycosyltransferase involved in cell wall biosynthesis